MHTKHIHHVVRYIFVKGIDLAPDRIHYREPFVGNVLIVGGRPWHFVERIGIGQFLCDSLVLQIIALRHGGVYDKDEYYYDIFGFLLDDHL